jgi:hypothetical protein
MISTNPGFGISKMAPWTRFPCPACWMLDSLHTGSMLILRWWRDKVDGAMNRPEKKTTKISHALDQISETAFEALIISPPAKNQLTPILN